MQLLPFLLVLPLTLTVWAPGAFPDYAWCDPQLTDMTFVDDLHGFAVGSCMSLYKTSDGGATWTRDDTTGDIGQLSAIHVVGSTALAVGRNAINQPTALVSSDSGASFGWHIFYLTDPTGVSNEGTLTGAAVLSDHVLVASASVWDGHGAVARSTDGGDSWETVAWLPTSARMIERIADEVVVVLASGDVYSSPDGGSPWSPRGTAPIASPLDSAVSGTTLVVVGAAGGAARSENGGATWVPLVTGTAVDLHAVAFDGSAIVVAGAAGTVLRSADGGASWTPELSLSSSDLFSLAFTSTAGLAGGTEEVLVRTSLTIA